MVQAIPVGGMEATLWQDLDRLVRMAGDEAIETVVLVFDEAFCADRERALLLHDIRRKASDLKRRGHKGIHVVLN